MLKVKRWEESPGVLEEVLLVKSDTPVLAGYYVRISGCLYSTRPAGTPQGPALWQVAELPAAAESEGSAAALLGRGVRRVLLSYFPEDDTQPSLVLDMGQQQYLHFYPVSPEEPAPAMALSPDCGEADAELRFSAELPLVVTVAPAVLRRVLAGRRLLGLGVAVFFSGMISAALGLQENVAMPIALCGLAAALAGAWLLKRKSICPWCGEPAFVANSVTGYFFCCHCGNSIDVKLP